MLSIGRFFSLSRATPQTQFGVRSRGQNKAAAFDPNAAALNLKFATILQRETQRHLNLPCAADRLSTLSEACGTRIESSVSHIWARVRESGSTRHRSRAEEGVLRHVVNGEVKTRVV